VNPAHLPAAVLAALAVIILVARLSGELARRLGQPAVIGEITAGLALGPSLLGLLPGDLPHRLFPTEARGVLNAVAQLGLVLFMFLIGLEADVSLVRGRVKLATTVSLSSIALPFALGVPLALVLHQRHHSGAAADLLPFVLFIGASLSITAFPVLARILTERELDRTPLGALALATASLDDVIAWSLLAVVVAIVVSGGPAGALLVALGAVVFSLVLVYVARPAMAALFRRSGPAGLSSGGFAFVLVGVLTAAWTTDRIGVHLVFGAFAFGVFFPSDPALREAVAHRVEAVTVLLLPVFFVVTGLGVDLSRISLGGLGELALILLVAVGGKVGGAYLAARLNGLDGRRALALGVLANTRGLTELVILGIGRQLGVLDAELFGLLVVMALVTTAMAGPLLDLVYPDRLVQQDLAVAERAAAGAMTVVTALPAAPSPWGALLAVSAGLAGSATRGHVLLSRVLPLTSGLGVGSLGLLAAEVDEVSRVGRDLAGPRITATPNVVRAHDAGAETRRQLGRVEADWLVATPGSAADLVGHTDQAPDRAHQDSDRADQDSDRAFVQEGPAADVVLVGAGPAPGEGPVLLTSSEPVAWEVAVRLALARRAALQVSTRSSGRQLVEAGRRLGLPVETQPDGRATIVVTDGDGGDSVTAVGPSATAPGPVTMLRVYPGGARRHHGLGERAARVPAHDHSTAIEELS
jgi:Kef-type K+ transport system membrane component KefB